MDLLGFHAFTSRRIVISKSPLSIKIDFISQQISITTEHNSHWDKKHSGRQHKLRIIGPETEQKSK